MLDNCVAVVNSKGGLGKTSIVANVAAAAALDGWRTLAVDLDPEALIARGLGYRGRPALRVKRLPRSRSPKRWHP